MLSEAAGSTPWPEGSSSWSFTHSSLARGLFAVCWTGSASSSSLLHLVVHPVQPAVEVRRPGGLRRGHAHHVVAGMEATSLAAAAEVIVGTGDTLVSESDDRTLAFVAGHSDVLLPIAVAGR